MGWFGAAAVVEAGAADVEAGADDGIGCCEQDKDNAPQINGMTR